MIYISVDPSSVYHAVATWEDGYLTNLRSCQPDALNILALMEEIRPHAMVIEGQWLGNNFQSAAKLLESRVRFQTVAELLGVPVDIIAPKTWQAYHKLTSFKGKELKAQSVVTASNITAKVITDHNLADAVNIGACWYAKHQAKAT